jgi:molybdate transport system ATP-binding protein
MPTSILKLQNLSFKAGKKQILSSISFEVYSGQALAITGKSGSGKTVLGKILAGIEPATEGEFFVDDSIGDNRRFISQQHDFRHLSTTSSYYQQRYEYANGNDAPTVKQYLQQSIENDQLQKWEDTLSLELLYDKQLFQLSNGEGKRVQLAKALLDAPKLLVLDQPFIGLDVHSREIVHQLINELVKSGICVFLITSPSEIPESISHILELENGQIKEFISKQDYIPVQNSLVQTSINSELLNQLPPAKTESDFDYALLFNNVNINIDGKSILQNINWLVKKGEKWALSGPNGSGKSTLLSLIYGDHPQVYKNDISLFDKRRGSGESIWAIKNRMGFVSPELHLFFQRKSTQTESVNLSQGHYRQSEFSVPKISCFEVVASGLHEQVGSSQKISSLQEKRVKLWLKILQMEKFINSSYYHLSLGEQRLVLLARALVKQPDLLLLDEPCQGLDAEQQHLFKSVLEQICERMNLTLIYVSHYKDELPSFIDHYLQLDNGKVV